METIIKFMHYSIAMLFTAVAFCFDVVFKFALALIFCAFAVILICIWPFINKKWCAPDWVAFLYDYLTKLHYSLYIKTWELWTEGLK